MKQLTCEMCGGTDLLKQDGVFVCQTCGTKYSIEEAKKMMVEGTVDVSGSTVKVDTSKELENLYQLARRAKDDNNNENAAKYYDMILMKDPSSWEANFFTVYFKSMTCKIAEISSAATKVNNCIESTFRLIADNVKDVDEKKKAIEEVKIHAFYISNLLNNAAQNHFDKMDTRIKFDHVKEYVANTCAAAAIRGTFYDMLIDVFGNDEQVMNPYGIGLLKYRLSEGMSQKIIDKYAAIIVKYDPSYVKPEHPKPQTTTKSQTTSSSPSSSSSGGCYVATAVYGSYDCPQVWTLRRYRDYTLAETWYGRAFIHTYYAISPTLVKWFGDTEWFKKMWKVTLDRMVADLQSKGIEATPYEDKNW